MTSPETLLRDAPPNLIYKITLDQGNKWLTFNLLSFFLSSFDQGTTHLSSRALVLHTPAMALNRALSTLETQNLVASASDLWLSVKLYLQYVTEMGCREWNSHEVPCLG